MEQTNLKAKSKKGKYGYINSKGKWVIEPQFQFAWDFIDGLGRVYIPPRIGGRYGFIKADGSFLVAPILESSRAFKEGFAAVKINNKWTFLKQDGTFLVEPTFDKIWDFHDGMALVKHDGNYDFILPNGQFKKLNKFEQYIVTLFTLQDTENIGWSYLEADCANGKWIFKGWNRLLEENPNWYEHKKPEEGEFYEMLRYTDKVSENKLLTNWANSLNLSTPEKVGELLWSSAQHLIIDSKLEQKTGGFYAPLSDITVLIQLYNQLRNIENQGMTDLREKLPLPRKEWDCFTSEKIKARGITLCENNMLFDEDGFDDLDFMKFVDTSHIQGTYEHNIVVESDEEV